MKAYGLNKIEASDTDAKGSASNGRPNHIYALKEASYHSLRGGKKAAARRPAKRRARRLGKAECAA